MNEIVDKRFLNSIYQRSRAQIVYASEIIIIVVVIVIIINITINITIMKRLLSPKTQTEYPTSENHTVIFKVLRRVRDHPRTVTQMNFVNTINCS